MKFIDTLPSHGETKLLVETSEGRTMVFMMSSSGISIHPDERHIEYCLKVIGSFRGNMEVTRGALPLARELTALNLPEYVEEKLAEYIIDWEREFEAHGHMDEPRRPILERLAERPTSSLRDYLLKKEMKKLRETIEKSFGHYGLETWEAQETYKLQHLDVVLPSLIDSNEKKNHQYGSYIKRKYR